MVRTYLNNPSISSCLDQRLLKTRHPASDVTTAACQTDLCAFYCSRTEQEKGNHSAEFSKQRLGGTQENSDHRRDCHKSEKNTTAAAIVKNDTCSSSQLLTTNLAVSPETSTCTYVLSQQCPNCRYSFNSCQPSIASGDGRTSEVLHEEGCDSVNAGIEATSANAYLPPWLAGNPQPSTGVRRSRQWLECQTSRRHISAVEVMNSPSVPSNLLASNGVVQKDQKLPPSSKTALSLDTRPSQLKVDVRTNEAVQPLSHLKSCPTYLNNPVVRCNEENVVRAKNASCFAECLHLCLTPPYIICPCVWFGFRRCPAEGTCEYCLHDCCRGGDGMQKYASNYSLNDRSSRSHLLYLPVCGSIVNDGISTAPRLDVFPAAEAQKSMEKLLLTEKPETGPDHLSRQQPCACGKKDSQAPVLRVERQSDSRPPSKSEILTQHVTVSSNSISNGSACDRRRFIVSSKKSVQRKDSSPEWWERTSKSFVSQQPAPPTPMINRVSAVDSKTEQKRGPKSLPRQGVFRKSPGNRKPVTKTSFSVSPSFRRDQFEQQGNDDKEKVVSVNGSLANIELSDGTENRPISPIAEQCLRRNSEPETAREIHILRQLSAMRERFLENYQDGTSDKPLS